MIVKGGNMSTLDSILSLLNKWPAWKRITDAPDRLDALEARVSALEKELGRCPAEGCPFCGARSWRLKQVDMHGKREVWHCLDCQKEREIYDPDRSFGGGTFGRGRR